MSQPTIKQTPVYDGETYDTTADATKAAIKVATATGVNQQVVNTIDVIVAVVDPPPPGDDIGAPPPSEIGMPGGA